MRLIPVIDVRHHVAVHAVAGHRETYQAVRSVLTQHTDPVRVAADLHVALGNRELYLADLDAIECAGTRQDSLIALSPAVVTTIAWAAQAGVTVLLDAGFASPADAPAMTGYDNVRLIVATETLLDLEALGELVQTFGKCRIVASLDMRDGVVLSRAQGLTHVSVAEAARLLVAQGIGELIVLDLARVGAGSGSASEVVGELAARYPEVALVAGGGVRTVADLDELARKGAAGALVATALHRGAITPAQWRDHAA